LHYECEQFYHAVVQSATDGRVLRGERNREAIVDALLALLEEGVVKPSAKQIAERAGVALRSVFQHFEDMEALYAVCVRRQYARIAPLLTELPATWALGERVTALVHQRALLYERVAPVRRATIVAASTSPALQEGLQRMNKAQRDQLIDVFGGELDRPNRREVLAALEVATSFDTWEQLRRAHGLAVAAAERCVARLATGVLAKGPS
jgi:AcrR family transcriptional regulator